MSKAVFTTIRGAVAGLAMGVATLTLSGCGSSDDDKNYVERPVEVLHNRALDALGAQGLTRPLQSFAMLGFAEGGIGRAHLDPPREAEP